MSMLEENKEDPYRPEPDASPRADKPEQTGSNQTQEASKQEQEEVIKSPADKLIIPAETTETLPGQYTNRETKFRDQFGFGETETLQLEDNISSPYFRVFSQRRKDDFLSDRTPKKDLNPTEYLKTVVDRYNVKYDMSDPDLPMVDTETMKPIENEPQPWIMGKLRKKIPPSERTGLFSKLSSPYKFKIFRLYADALVWFDLPSFFMRKGWKKDCTQFPDGVLPLALVSGVKAPGLAEIMAYAEDPLDKNESIPNIDDSALTVIELELGKGQGVIKLKAEDWRQRFKWIECMNIAIFDNPEAAQVSRVSKLTQDCLKVTSRKPSFVPPAVEDIEIGSASEDDQIKPPSTPPNNPHKATLQNLGSNVVQIASDVFAIRSKSNTIRAHENHSLPVM